MKRAIGTDHGSTWECHGCATVYLKDAGGVDVCETCQTFFQSSLAILIAIEERLTRIEAKLGIAAQPQPEAPGGPLGPKRCTARWRAGLVTPPPPARVPDDNAQCIKPNGHHLIAGDEHHTFPLRKDT